MIDVDDFNNFCEEMSESLEKAEELLIGYEGIDKGVEEALAIIQDVIYNLR